MKPMPESELLSRLHYQFTPLKKAVDALIEFLDTNGYHDASRALAVVWDNEFPDPDESEDQLAEDEITIESLSEALKAFVAAKSKNGKWNTRQLDEAKEEAESALKMAE